MLSIELVVVKSMVVALGCMYGSSVLNRTFGLDGLSGFASLIGVASISSIMFLLARSTVGQEVHTNAWVFWQGKASSFTATLLPL